MNFKGINLNNLRIFAAVYEARSMTKAAATLFLTQSGVSQHIKSLEEELEVQLFQRVGRRVVPTTEAQALYADTEKALAILSHRLDKIHGAPKEVAGPIRIGMPIEFGKNVLIPILSQIGRKHPKLQFEIVLEYAVTLNQLLVEGHLDFAVVDEYPLDRRIEYKPIASETLLLCANREYIGRFSKVAYKTSFFEQLEYVEYRGAEPVLRQWMLHHLKRKNLQLNVRAHIMDVQGVAKFITCGLAVGVLPDHVANRLVKEGEPIYIFEGRGKPLVNEIRLAKLKTVQLSIAAATTMEELRNKLI